MSRTFSLRSQGSGVNDIGVESYNNGVPRKESVLPFGQLNQLSGVFHGHGHVGIISVSESGTLDFSLNGAAGTSIGGGGGATDFTGSGIATINGEAGPAITIAGDGVTTTANTITIASSIAGSGLRGINGATLSADGSDIVVDAGGLSGLVQQLANSGIVGAGGITVTQVGGDWVVTAPVGTTNPGSGLAGVNGADFTWNGSELVVDTAPLSGLIGTTPGSGLVSDGNGVDLTWTDNNIEVQSASLSGLIQQLANSGIIGTNAATVTQVGGNWVVDVPAGMVQPGSGLTTEGNGATFTFNGVNLEVGVTALSGLVQQLANSGVEGVNGVSVTQVNGDWIVDGVALSGQMTTLSGSGLAGANGSTLSWNGTEIFVDSAALSGILLDNQSGSGIRHLGESTTGDVQPVLRAHMESGVFHDGHGSSGIIRYHGGALQGSVDGGLTYSALGGDNLGNHTATTNLAMGGFYLTHQAVPVFEITASFSVNGSHIGSRVRFSGFTAAQVITVEADTISTDAIGAGIITLENDSPNRPLTIVADAGLTGGITGDLALQPGETAHILFSIDGLSAKVVRLSPNFMSRGIVTTDPDPALKNSLYLMDASAGVQNFGLEKADGRGGMVMLQVSGVNTVTAATSAGDSLNGTLNGTIDITGDNSLWLFIERDATSWAGIELSSSSDASIPGSGLIGNNGVELTWIGSDIVADAAGLSGLVEQVRGSGTVGVNGIEALDVNGEHVIDAAALSGLIPKESGLVDTGHGVSITWVDTDIQVDGASLSGLVQQLANSGIVGVNGVSGVQVGGDWVIDAAPLSGLLIDSSGIAFYNVENTGEFLDIEAKDDMTLTAGVSDGVGTGGRLLLEAYAGSGTLEYLFGPNEAWHANGFPLPHSGQICEMIAEKAGSGLIGFNKTNLGDQLIVQTRDDLTLTAGDADGVGVGGQLNLQAFAGSGTLNYAFGVEDRGWRADGLSVARRFAELVSSTTSTTITHNIGSSGIIVQAYDNDSGTLVTPDTIVITGINAVNLTFSSPFTGQVVITG